MRTDLPAGPLARPGFGGALLLLLVMFAAMGCGMLIILIGGRILEFNMLLLGAVQVFAMLLVLLIGVRVARAGPGQIFALRTPAAWMLCAAVFLAPAFALLMNALGGHVERLIPMPEDYAVLMAQLLYPQSGADWIRVLAVAVVLIPIGEELIFRGLFLRGFVLRYGTLPALTLTALLFAIVHLNPWAFVEIFLAGWLLGWLVLRSGSLWPAVVVHGLYNLTNVLLLVSGLGGPPTPARMERLGAGVWGSPAVVLIAGGVVLFLVLLFERHGARRAPWQTN